jgi:tRNA(Ile)-lysidine synthase TilS/MesJ
MQCDKCRGTAVLFQEYSGKHLCRQHFVADVEAKAKHEIRRHRWIMPGDHIAVALSGDNCSTAVLCFLKKLTLNRCDIKISAITVDEGIAGYRKPEDAIRIANLLDTPCITGSFQETFKISSDELADTKGPLACTYCRILKSCILDRIARKYGVTKLAVGDTLDEGAVLVLKNILRGMPGRIAGSGQATREKIPLIRPFILVPHKEVALYEELHMKSSVQSSCPYKFMPFEKDVKDILNEFSIRHPATKYALMSLEKNMGDACVPGPDSIPSCEKNNQLSGGSDMDYRFISELISRGG